MSIVRSTPKKNHETDNERSSYSSYKYLRREQPPPSSSSAENPLAGHSGIFTSFVYVNKIQNEVECSIIFFRDDSESEKKEEENGRRERGGEAVVHGVSVLVSRCSSWALSGR